MFIVASSARIGSMLPRASGARIIKLDCGVIRLGLRRWKFETEIDQALLVPVDFPQIQLRLDLADFIANPMRHHRRLRIVQHDAFVAIEPASPL